MVGISKTQGPGLGGGQVKKCILSRALLRHKRMNVMSKWLKIPVGGGVAQTHRASVQVCSNSSRRRSCSLKPIVRAAKCFFFFFFFLTYNQSMHDDCSLVLGTLKHEICFFGEEMEFLKRERERERGVNGWSALYLKRL